MDGRRGGGEHKQQEDERDEEAAAHPTAAAAADAASSVGGGGGGGQQGRKQAGRGSNGHGNNGERGRQRSPSSSVELRPGVPIGGRWVVRDAVVVANGEGEEEEGKDSSAAPHLPPPSSANGMGGISSHARTSGRDYWSLPSAVFDPHGYAPTRVTIVQQEEHHPSSSSSLPRQHHTNDTGLSRVLSLSAASSASTVHHPATHAPISGLVGTSMRGLTVAAVPESIEIVGLDEEEEQWEQEQAVAAAIRESMALEAGQGQEGEGDGEEEEGDMRARRRHFLEGRANGRQHRHHHHHRRRGRQQRPQEEEEGAAAAAAAAGGGAGAEENGGLTDVEADAEGDVEEGIGPTALTGAGAAGGNAGGGGGGDVIAPLLVPRTRSLEMAARTLSSIGGSVGSSSTGVLVPPPSERGSVVGGSSSSGSGMQRGGEEEEEEGAGAAARMNGGNSGGNGGGSVVLSMGSNGGSSGGGSSSSVVVQQGAGRETDGVISPLEEIARSNLGSTGSNSSSVCGALPVARPLMACEPSSYTVEGGPPVIENATANQDAQDIVSLSTDQIRLYHTWKTSKRLANGCFLSILLTAFWVLRFRAAFTLLLVPLMGWYGARGLSPLVVAAFLLLQCIPAGIRIYALVGWEKHPPSRDPTQEGSDHNEPLPPGAQHAILALYAIGLLLEFALLVLGAKLFVQLRRCHPLEIRLLRTVYQRLFRQVERQTEGRCTC